MAKTSGVLLLSRFNADALVHEYLYKYPQAAFPYSKLIEETAAGAVNRREYELLDTGVFEDNRYFDVFVEYAKADPKTFVFA